MIRLNGEIERQGRVYDLFLKYGWSIEDFNNFNMLRINIPCSAGLVRFDYWPSTSNIKRTGDCRKKSNIVLDVEQYICKYLLKMQYYPKGIDKEIIINESKVLHVTF